MKIKLTMLQRLSLDGLLSVQEGKAEDLETFFDVRKKVRVPNREEYIRDVLGRAVVDEDSIRQAPDIEVDFERAEMRKLLRLFESWPRFTTGDLEWMLPIRAAFTLAIKTADEP